MTKDSSNGSKKLESSSIESKPVIMIDQRTPNRYDPVSSSISEQDL